MFVTFDMSKFERSSEVKEEQSSKSPSIFVTFLTARAVEPSPINAGNKVKEEQPENICFIFVTLLNKRPSEL